MQLLIDYLESSGLTPHGYCMLWRWDLIFLHVFSDLVIAAAYLTIPFAIYRIVRGRKDIQYRSIPLLFAAFITACALTHIAALISMWTPIYTLQGIIKLGCAIISGVTAVLLFRLVPVLISMPGPAQLAQKNKELEAEVARRSEAERELHTAHEELHAAHADLRRANRNLEDRVEARTAELHRANEELERFAYVASHDLRAPLRPLMTVPGWLRETLTTHYGEVIDDVEIDLTEMELQSTRMDALLTDLLTFARIGQTNELLQEVETLKLIEDSALLSGLPPEFEVSIDSDLPPVYCVPTEFNLLMRNLMTNAVKHHDKPAGKIRISGQKSDTGVTITVSDDGPGISEKYASKVFEMFSTLRPRDEVEGSGMGLAMVRKIMQRIGGSVSLGTPPSGQGASFHLFFPNLDNTYAEAS